MKAGRRWELVDDETAESLREARPRGRVRRLAVSALTFAAAGPLLACNPKGGYPYKDSSLFYYDTDTGTTDPPRPTDSGSTGAEETGETGPGDTAGHDTGLDSGTTDSTPDSGSPDSGSSDTAGDSGAP